MVDRWMITALLAAIVVQSATIFDLFLPQATYFSYTVQILVFAFYLVFPVFRVTASVLLVAIGIIVFLAVEHVIFSRLAAQPYNFNALLAYFPILSFYPLYRSKMSIDFICSRLFVVAGLYVVLYVIGYNFILHGVFAQNRAIRTGDVERGVRLYLAAAFASYVAFYAITNFRMPFVVRAAMFCFAATAIWLSGFRTFGIIFLLLVVVSRLRLLGYGTRLGLFVFFLAMSCVMLLGLVIPGWNPFNYMTWDGSAYARSLEYRYAIQSVQQHWISGIGVGGFEALQEYLRTPKYEPFYATDLGILGPLVLFGLVGLAAFVAATYFCIVPPIDRNELPGFRGLRMNGILCGLLGVISPSILLEQNSLFLSILAVAWIRSGQSIRRRAYEPLWFEALPVASRSSLRLFDTGIAKHVAKRGTHYAPPTDRRTP